MNELTRLEEAHFRFEKCDVEHARKLFLNLHKEALKKGNFGIAAKAAVGVLRCAMESQDELLIKEYLDAVSDLEARAEALPVVVQAEIAYVRGALYARRGHFRKARRAFRKALGLSRISIEGDAERLEARRLQARALVMIATVVGRLGQVKRSEFLTDVCLSRYGEERIRGVNGSAWLNRASLWIQQGDFSKARIAIDQSQSAFLSEHNWFQYLYVLGVQAHLARKERRYAQAQFYLLTIDQATQQRAGFSVIRNVMETEKKALEQDAVDILIDTESAVVRTQEHHAIPLRKQHLLLELLMELGRAHVQGVDENERCLTKADLIERVWKERYRPEAHDNKLYYNINRLRKLLEPDLKHPKYLINARDGYRLAPGLRVQFTEGNTEAYKG